MAPKWFCVCQAAMLPEIARRIL